MFKDCVQLVFLVVSLPESLEVVLEISRALLVIVGVSRLELVLVGVAGVPVVGVVLEGGEGVGGLPGDGRRPPTFVPPLVLVAVSAFIRST